MKALLAPRLVISAAVLAACLPAAGQTRTRPQPPADPVARKSEVEALRKQVQQLEARIRQLEAALARLTTPAAAQRAGPPVAAAEPTAAELQRAIDAAAEQGRLIKGMTPGEASRAMRRKPDEESTDSDGRKVLVWSEYSDVVGGASGGLRSGAAYGGSPGRLTRRVRAWFTDDALVDFEDSKSR